MALYIQKFILYIYIETKRFVGAVDFIRLHHKSAFGEHYSPDYTRKTPSAATPRPIHRVSPDEPVVVVGPVLPTTKSSWPSTADNQQLFS